MEIKKDDLINLTKEELYKDNESMFKSYKEYKKKYIIIMEIDKKLKIDLKNIENKYLELENINKKLNDNLNVLTNEKTIWINKDKYMTEFLNRNGFIDPDELESFIIEYKSHNCLCSCPAIEHNEKYKEQVMNVDILKFNEKERLRVEKENDELRYDIDIGMKKRDKVIENLNNKLLLVNNKVRLEKSNVYNEYLLNNYNNEINNELYYIKDVKVQNINSLDLKLEKPNEVIINNLNPDDISKDNNISILFNENEENSNNIKYDNKIENINEEENEEDDISQISDDSDNINDNKSSQKRRIKTIEELCPIYIFEDTNKDWKKHIANKTRFSLIYNDDLKNLLNKDNININEAVDYIIKYKQMKNSKSNIEKIKVKIERSIYVYNIYKEKLKIINFDLNKMARLNIKDYNKWLEYLEKKINEIDKIKVPNLGAGKNNEKINEIENNIEPLNNIKLDENKTKETVIIDIKSNEESDVSDYELDEEYNYCIIDNCDNYVPEKGWTCKSHF